MTQLGFDGEVPWDEASPKAQEKRSQPIIRSDRNDQVDKEVIQWMRRLGYSVSVDELADRLKPVGYSQGAVANSMRRLRKHHRIISDGEVDDRCEMHKVLSNFRWRPVD